jgi:excinuclease ABC subunit B
VAEQIIRPTGLLDPENRSRKPSLGQIDDIMQEINQRIAAHERVMIVTLTIKMAEDLTSYLERKRHQSHLPA